MEAKTAARGSLEHVTASDGELLRRYHRDGDVVARQLLIERHVGFVRRLAKRYSHRGEATEDLVQVGCVGLIKAIDRYDGQFQASLATMRRPTCSARSSATSATRAGPSGSPRCPGAEREAQPRGGRADVKLGRSPSVEELAEATKTTPEEVLEALDSSRAYSAFSLSDRTDDDEEGPSPLDTLGEEDEGFRRTEDRDLLQHGLERLAGRERTILHMRFFEGLTQSEIAERVGISQMHVSRLIRQSLARVKEVLSREGLDDSDLELAARP